MGDHMPSILKQEQVGSVQRLVEISGLAGLDYLILCSMEDPHLAVNVWIRSLELCSSGNQEGALVVSHHTHLLLLNFFESSR
jgi:hypothetical protein